MRDATSKRSSKLLHLCSPPTLHVVLPTTQTLSVMNHKYFAVFLLTDHTSGLNDSQLHLI